MRIDADAVKKRSMEFVPFTHEELESASASWTNLNSEVEGIAGYVEGVREIWGREAHTTHKTWGETARAAEELAKIVSGPDDAVFKKVFSRYDIKHEVLKNKIRFCPIPWIPRNMESSSIFNIPSTTTPLWHAGY